MAYTTPQTGEVVANGVEEDDVRVEIVLERDLYEYLRESGALDVDRLTDNPNFEAGRVEDLPFGLIIADRSGTTEVCLAVYGQERALEGIIINDTPEAVEWAESIWDRYANEATPID